MKLVRQLLIGTDKDTIVLKRKEADSTGKKDLYLIPKLIVIFVLIKKF